MTQPLPTGLNKRRKTDADTVNSSPPFTRTTRSAAQTSQSGGASVSTPIATSATSATSPTSATTAAAPTGASPNSLASRNAVPDDSPDLQNMNAPGASAVDTESTTNLPTIVPQTETSNDSAINTTTVSTIVPQTETSNNSASSAPLSSPAPSTPVPSADTTDDIGMDAHNSTILAPTSDAPSPCAWPAGRVPVEIFNIIIQFLARRDIQMMRLVNREFDAKLAEKYFSVVVVPFRPEFEALYGQLNIKSSSTDGNGSADDENGSQGPGNDSLLSAGHRVFQQFGDKMRKFALALEINEDDLAYPPLKINQEILTAPWGLYRWPIMSYQRYTEVEGLEKLANETGSMGQAFEYLKSVNEIGISCDPGLGWLHGPDTNPFGGRTQPPVFRPIAYGGLDTSNAANDVTGEKLPPGLSALKQMACNAGYHALDWPRVILRLLEDEGRVGVVQWIERILPTGRLTRERIPYLKVDSSTSDDDIIRQIRYAINCSDDFNSNPDDNGALSRSLALVPCHLSKPQSEMLLELEWAHRALMQSFRLAVMDNKDSFQNLKVLNIARCPSSRVITWCDDAFWETMTSIHTFRLGVIPDWREIRKNPNGAIDQRRVPPSDACQIVFRLFQFYVAEQKNVKDVSFEWVCGGEFATGKSQRDRYILPAPILADKRNMVNVAHFYEPDDIVNLPYVTKLSLKNCWFSPHVFTFFFEHMALEALEEVVLESVSLTGPPTLEIEPSIYPAQASKPSHWPWPLCVGAEDEHWFYLTRTPNLHAGHGPHGWGAHHQPVVALNLAAHNVVGHAQNAHGAPAGASAAVAVNHPTATAPALQHNDAHSNRWRAWSWPHVLARLGMAPDAVHQHLEDSSPEDVFYEGQLKNIEKRYHVRFRGILDDRTYHNKSQVISFKSCGYALVDVPNIDNWKIIPNQPIQVHQSADFVTRLRELDSLMLTSNDSMLAKIINYMPEEEERHLRVLYNFELGWDNLYDPVIKQAAIADGNPHPGQARFCGSVNNKTTSAKNIKTLLESEGKPAGSYRY